MIYEIDLVVIIKYTQYKYNVYDADYQLYMFM